MTPSEIIQNFISNIQQTGTLEWISTISQLTSVWFARKNNSWVYPTGIIGVVLAAYLYFFQSTPPLYADGLLNVYFLFMSIYGWYNWLQKKEDAALKFPITHCSQSDWISGSTLFFMSWGTLYFLLVRITDSNTPMADSMVSASAITAMWWMAKRKIEHWLAWTVSNLVAIPLNFYKGFMLFTVMYFLFLFLSIWGYWEWKKQLTPLSNSAKNNPRHA